VIGVQVVDAGSGGVADKVRGVLDQSGFLVKGVTTSNPYGVTGPAVVFAPTPTGKAAADVVTGYLGNVPEVKAAPGTLHGNDIAVVVTPDYAGNPVAPAPTPSPGSSSC
jgi:hypothetical protein